MADADRTALQAALRDVPPSAKLVAKTLEYEGELTQGQLAEQTRLPRRTVRYALGELEPKGIVTSRIYLGDARKRLYSLAPPLREADEPTTDPEADRALVDAVSDGSD